MANSRYGYVREFESATDPKLLPDSFVVVRVDGQCFHRFTKDHNFLKPNDKRCLDLMSKSALHVMRTFYPNIILAYGQSDEFSFVLRRFANFFNRRQNKITSLITSAFSSAFVYYWPQFFNWAENKSLNFKRFDQYIPNDSNEVSKSKTNNVDETNQNTSLKTFNDVKLRYPPSFDGRCVLYPNEKTLTDYLKWRQVDCHINNLYNTTFYALTGEYSRSIPSKQNSDCFDVFLPDPMHNGGKNYFSHQDATKKLSGSISGDKNEILFTDYGINYNNELEQFRKGTVFYLNPPNKSHTEEIESISNESMKGKSKSKSVEKKYKLIEQRFSELAIDDQEKFFEKSNVDIIGETFWQQNEHLLRL